jgi:hypothetical protein
MTPDDDLDPVAQGDGSVPDATDTPVLETTDAPIIDATATGDAGTTTDAAGAESAVAETSVEADGVVAPAGPTVPPTPEELAELAAAVMAARPAPRPIAPPPEEAPAEVKLSTTARIRRRVPAKGLMRLMSLVIGLVLLAAGVGLGRYVFEATRPEAAPVGDPATGNVPTPAIVEELVTALASNDADSLRSAVPADPYRLLAGELQSWNVQGVTSVETLATMQDGDRTATEIVIIGRGTDGQPITFNLIVHVTSNQIVNFR